jgi:hypothetical protein
MYDVTRTGQFFGDSIDLEFGRIFFHNDDHGALAPLIVVRYLLAMRGIPTYHNKFPIVMMFVDHLSVDAVDWEAGMASVGWIERPSSKNYG